MNLTIHRGAREIGGTCIELRSADSRLLIDFGLPLVDEWKGPFDSRKIRNKSVEELVHTGVLPAVTGLYRDGPAGFDAILLSHPHQDHYGLLSFVHPDIPIYMSEGCRRLIEASHYFSQTDCKLENITAVKPWETFEKGAFAITPYLVDHSGFDALAFLIEGKNRKILYSGDFRGHGRKGVVFENMVRRPPKAVDYLILEGSMMGRPPGPYGSERDVENELVRLFKNDDLLFFAAFSSQNIDRIVSLYRACVRSNRVLVIDPYTAYILDRLKDVSPHIPQFNWGRNIRIFFVPNAYTKKMAEDKSLFRFRSAKITYEELQEMKSRIVLKDTYTTRSIFSRKKAMSGVALIYSLWEGYLHEARPFWDKHGVPIIEVHCSGHAYVEDLQRFVAAIRPRRVIPIHTFHPEAYETYFGERVQLIADREPTEM